MKKLAVVVPCYNEEAGIGKVIDNVPVRVLRNHGIDAQVFVIDNNSTDKTSEVARAHGATVLLEKKKGKGNAMRTGFASLPKDIDFVVMLDGDDTYRGSEMLRMIEPLTNDFCDCVVGSRLGGRLQDGSLRFTNRLGNWGFTFLVRIFYRANVTDVLSGYFAWKRPVIDALLPHITSDGFAIEMEMITRMERLGFDMFSVPISYDHREGETNLNRYVDGAKILRMFLKNLFWKPKNVQMTTEGAEA